MKRVIIFTDGACRRNPGPGGWAALLRFEQNEKSIYGAEPDTTNNRMELMAAIQSFAALDVPHEVELHTDSQYVQKGMTEWLPNWKKRHWKTSTNKPVKNADLWKKLDQYTTMHRVSWYWVKAHNGHVENEFVDALANKAIDDFLCSGLKK